MSEIDLDGIEMAARSMDWMQVILNQGAPCMTIEHGRFCGRAERWDGHADEGKHGHAFVSLADVTAQLCARIREQDAEIEDKRVEILELSAFTKLSRDAASMLADETADVVVTRLLAEIARLQEER